MPDLSVGDVLFTKTKQRVLGLLYGAPDQRFYANDIVRRVDMGRGTVRRELERLAASSILKTVREGNQQFYQANPACSIYNELHGATKSTNLSVNTVLLLEVTSNRDLARVMPTYISLTCSGISSATKSIFWIPVSMTQLKSTPLLL